MHTSGAAVRRSRLRQQLLKGNRHIPAHTLTPDDIAHYHRIVITLKHTIHLMDEIDQAIEFHGAWPIE